MGRHKEDNPKKNRIEIRLTDAELEQIDYIAHALDISRSAAILDAVESRCYEIEEVQREREARIK